MDKLQLVYIYKYTLLITKYSELTLENHSSKYSMYCVRTCGFDPIYVRYNVSKVKTNNLQF